MSRTRERVAEKKSLDVYDQLIRTMSEDKVLSLTYLQQQRKGQAFRKRCARQEAVEEGWTACCREVVAQAGIERMRQWYLLSLVCNLQLAIL